jgi:histidine ammonia-lyase
MTTEIELGAVTDNPLVFPSGEPQIVSGANFHGMPLALPLDYLAIALCHLAGISERRTYLITGAFEPESHLKPFLAPRPGLQSGLMIAQYTAAACVNEMIGLATPASVANIPTCAGMEDYNSFGPRSAAKARRSLELARRVLAIELLCAAQALELHRPLKSGKGVEWAHTLIREHVPSLTEDRPLTDDIEAIAGLIERGAFSQAT